MKSEIRKRLDYCPRSYDLEHLWREGDVYKPLSIFWCRFQNIGFGKPVLKLRICQACGMCERLNEKEVTNNDR